MHTSSRPVSPSDPDLTPRPLSGARHRGEFQQRTARFLDAAGSAWAELGALVLPVECAACGAEDEALCATCRERLRHLTNMPFRAEGNAASLVGFDGAVLLPVMAAGVYRDELAQVILAFKRLGQRRLQNELADALARAVAAGVPAGVPLVLVPVPSSSSAYRRRGFNPVQLLLSALRPRLGPRITVQDFLRVRGSGNRVAGFGGQKGLGRGDRAKRMRNSMAVRVSRRHFVTGRHIVLVDDVLTTGATLSAAAQATAAAGGLVHGAVVLASARPPENGRETTPAGRQHSPGPPIPGPPIGGAEEK